MAKRANPFLTDDENPELTDADFGAMRPASDAMPSAVFGNLVETAKRERGQRGPGKKPALVPVTLNLDADVAAALKAGGKGWQGRLRTIVRTIVHEDGTDRTPRVGEPAGTGRGTAPKRQRRA